MNHQEFTELKKTVYNPAKAPTKEWSELIFKYNQAKGTDLQTHLKSTYLTILEAIAKKNNWEFKPIDLHEEGSMYDQIVTLGINNIRKEKWHQLDQLAKGEINKTTVKW